MIWNKKRIKGVMVYIGKQKGAEPGAYLVVYHCNGLMSNGNLDAVGTLMDGQKFPSVSCSVDSSYLRGNFYPISQREIPLPHQSILARWIVG